MAAHETAWLRQVGERARDVVRRLHNAGKAAFKVLVDYPWDELGHSPDAERVERETHGRQRQRAVESIGGAPVGTSASPHHRGVLCGGISIVDCDGDAAEENGRGTDGVARRHPGVGDDAPAAAQGLFSGLMAGFAQGWPANIRKRLLPGWQDEGYQSGFQVEAEWAYNSITITMAPCTSSS